MLSHLRTKYPIQFVNTTDDKRQEYDEEQSGTDGNPYCSVEVTLEDGDSDDIPTVSGAEIACAINGLLDAEEVAAKLRKRKEAGGDGPSPRKRSWIWMYYEHLEHQKVALCLLCMKKMKHNNNTSNLHRHLSMKHPEAFAQLGGKVKKPPSFKSAAPQIHPSILQCLPNKADTSKPSQTIAENFPVEVTLEDGDSDAIPTVSGAEISCAINGFLDAEEVAAKQREQKEADGPSPRKRSCIWMYFDYLTYQKIALCLLCMKKIQRNRNTSNLHRHLSTKHPEAFAQLGGKVKKPPSFKSAAPLIHPSTLQYPPNKADSSKPSQTIAVKENFPVEVTLEDGDSDDIATVSGAEIACAINGLLDAEEVAAKLRKRKEAGGDGPSPRKRSSIWMYYEHLEHQKVALCLLCMKKMQHHNNTSNLHRHLSTKHPEAFALLGGKVKKPPSLRLAATQIHPFILQCSPNKADASKPSQTFEVKENFPVEVTLEDGDSDTIPTVSGVEIACAINGLLDAEEVAAKLRKRKEAGGDGPSPRKRSWIWMYYEHLEHQKVALCLLCMKKMQHNNNTSNLHRHLSTKHPEAFAQLGGKVKKPPSFKSAAPQIHPSILQCSPNKADASKPSQTIVVKEDFPDLFEVTRVSEEVRVLERERELTEALRNSQKHEARTLEQQKELLEILRAANAREAAAERASIELLRRAQEEESKDLSRQREELRKEREDLQMKWSQLQQEREELQLCRGQQSD